MVRKQDLRSCLQLLAILTVAMVASQGQDSVIGKPMFAVRPAEPVVAEAALSASTVTVHHWTNSFPSKGNTFSYSMVGASPFANPGATVTINTEIQPITFKFANGNTISGSAAALAIANSPIFVETKFPTETGQYADAFQRANFAKPIGGKPYHVLLGLPSVRRALVVNVPQGSGTTRKSNSGVLYGLVNFDFLTRSIASLARSGHFNPASLPIFVSGNVFEYQQMISLCCILGYHEALTPAAGQLLTYIYASYPAAGLLSGGFADAAVLSHEVAEWMDDPFGTNVVVPWGQPQYPQACFSNLLEVGDAIEAFSNANFTVSLNGKTYHLQDEAFFSWFARQSPSIGAGGRYSYISPAKLTRPAPACK